jgi:streptogramin lyase
LAQNGKIYCIPNSATSVGVIDPVANTFSSVIISGTAPGGGAYAGGILGPNGKIYCLSHNSGNIGIIDPVANTFTTFGSAPGGQAYIGAILAPNGNIYCIPYGTSAVGLISFAGLKQLPSCLSAYANKY